MTGPEREELRERVSLERWARVELRRAEAALWKDDARRNYQDPREVCDLELADTLEAQHLWWERKHARARERRAGVCGLR